jgi:hypothetical protein
MTPIRAIHAHDRLNGHMSASKADPSYAHKTTLLAEIVFYFNKTLTVTTDATTAAKVMIRTAMPTTFNQ